MAAVYLPPLLPENGGLIKCRLSKATAITYPVQAQMPGRLASFMVLPHEPSILIWPGM
jgi:hypothetical protein